MKNNYIIKEVDISDLKNALSLVWNTFLEFEAPEYSDEGIEEFKNYIEYEDMKKRIINSELLLWGCYDKDNIIGVIAVRIPSHISLLFVNKEYHRQGIAKALFNKSLEYYYKNNINISEMTVNSSPYAQEVYRKLGFVDTNSEQIVNGIRFISMKNVNICEQ